jgi:enoyl-CoA hydratase/carnithine racemase
VAPSPDFAVLREGDDEVVVLRLERPKVNALSTGLLDALADALLALHEQPPGALVLTGGPRVFAAGAEISELADATSAAALIGAFARAFQAVADLACPTIAAVNGVALGGGLELALACDLRLVADDSRLALPEVGLGLFPGAGGTQRLARLIGAGRAKEIIFTGRQVRAEEAVAIGLANGVAPAEALLDAAVELGSRLADGPRHAIATAKRLIDEGLDAPLAAGLAAERTAFLTELGHTDAAIGIASFFESGPGKARFGGREAN